jgi:hypothetical protein
MSRDVERLLTLVPAPLHPFGSSGDRAKARAALGWHVPDHVFDVIDVYGDARWMRRLLVRSPYLASGRKALTQNRDDDDQQLIGYRDPRGLLVCAGDDGVVVIGPKEEKQTKHTLAEFLYAWLSGAEAFELPPVARLAGMADARPYALPAWDLDREAALQEVVVKGGAAKRAERWERFSAALEPFVHCNVVSDGETRQDRIYLPDLEAEVFFDSYRGPGKETLHLTYYLDRQDELDARLDAALAAAGMTRPDRASPAAPAAKKRAPATKKAKPERKKGARAK